VEDPWTQTEITEAKMPDGRILLIERQRAPRLKPVGQQAFALGILVAAGLLPFLISPALSLMFFAGLWSGAPIMLAYAALSFIAWTKATDWASSPPEDPPYVRVVGMDLSTDELISFMRPAAELEPSPRSLH